MKLKAENVLDPEYEWTQSASGTTPSDTTSIDVPATPQLNNLLADPGIPDAAFSIGSRSSPPNVIPSSAPSDFTATDPTARTGGIVEGVTSLEATDYPGAVQPGTTIVGLPDAELSTGERASELAVQRGSQIIADAAGGQCDPTATFANGKPDESDVIVFTSASPRGNRDRGDWGGLVLNGQAPINTGDEADQCLEISNNGGNSDVGLLQREGSVMTVVSTIITGFGASGFDVEGAQVASVADERLRGTTTASFGPASAHHTRRGRASSGRGHPRPTSLAPCASATPAKSL